MGATRRHFLAACAGSFGAVCAGCVGQTSADVRTSDAADIADTARETAARVAVSLGSLQRTLRGTDARAGQPRVLPALNRVDGFVWLDQDLVLYGRFDAATPSIEIDTLAVALRNAYGAGPNAAGDPGCSIDPRPGGDPWRVQDVTVFGMPHDCAMAARHVNLDYELKWAGAGIRARSDLPVKGVFDSSQEDNPICGHAKATSADFSHRYWFCPLQPDAPRYARCDRDVDILRPVQVQVLAEQQFRGAQGRVTGSAQPSSEAVEFAGQVTALLGAGTITRYRELVNDFRVVELARLARFVEPEVRAFEYLLHEYALATLEVPSVVGGVQRERTETITCGTRRTPVAGGIELTQEIEHRRQSYRGGVEVSVKIVPDDFRSDAPCPSPTVRDRVLAARPRSGSVTWQVPLG